MGPSSVSGSSGLPPYKRRRPIPALVLFVVLAVVAVFVWVEVLNSANDLEAAIKCNPPGNVTSVSPTEAAVPVKHGTVIGHDALDRTDPVPVADVHFRVFNASTQRNQAKFVATTLTELGLKQAADTGQRPALPGAGHALPRADPLRRPRCGRGTYAEPGRAVP